MFLFSADLTSPAARSLCRTTKQVSVEPNQQFPRSMIVNGEPVFVCACASRWLRWRGRLRWINDASISQFLAFWALALGRLSPLKRRAPVRPQQWFWKSAARSCRALFTNALGRPKYGWALFALLFFHFCAVACGLLNGTLVWVVFSIIHASALSALLPSSHGPPVTLMKLSGTLRSRRVLRRARVPRSCQQVCPRQYHVLLHDMLLAPIFAGWPLLHAKFSWWCDTSFNRCGCRRRFLICCAPHPD